MGLRGKTPFLTIQGNMDADRYRNNILTPHVLPLMINMPNQGLLFLEISKIFLKGRLSVSPNLPPLFHLWDLFFEI